jgi:hypothetical protein
MKLNWKSVNATHVTKACEQCLNSKSTGAKASGLVVTYQGKQLPAKTVLRIAYGLANNISAETKIKFASSESSLQRDLLQLGYGSTACMTQRPSS